VLVIVVLGEEFSQGADELRTTQHTSPRVRRAVDDYELYTRTQSNKRLERGSLRIVRPDDAERRYAARGGGGRRNDVIATGARDRRQREARTRPYFPAEPPPLLRRTPTAFSR
jgi:hypothetical protein